VDFSSTAYYHQDNSISSFTSLTVSAFSTSTYVSPVNYSLGLGGFQMFTVSDVSSGTTPSFYMRLSSESFSWNDNVLSWVAQPANSKVVVPVHDYYQFMVDPNIIVDTQNVTVNSISIGYTQGQVSPRAASVVDDHRYIASVSHNSETENDFTYIWQKNKEWVPSDQAYGAMSQYNNKPVAGSTDNSSKLWNIMDPAATSFDGEVIISSWTTKDFTLGDVHAHKVINRVWVSAENTGLYIFRIDWQSNRNGTWSGANTSLATSAFINKEVEGLFPSGNLHRQISFRLSSNTLNKIFRLKMFSLYFTINPLIKD
jgi:hypothetical protein